MDTGAGDKELGDLLVDLLVDRSKYDTRTILQTVLNESFSVAPKFTNDQLAELSIIFMARYILHNGIHSLDTFTTYLDKYIAPFTILLSDKASCYQHSEYAGCGSISVQSITVGHYGVENYFQKQYPGIFSKGFQEEALRNRQINLDLDNPIFTQCLHNPNKQQIDAMNEQSLRVRANELNISEEEIPKLIELNNSCLMNADEIRQYLSDLRQYMQKVCDIWA